MTRFPIALLCAGLMVGVPGCKIVKDAPAGHAAIAADASGDDARTAQRITDTFQPKLLPYLREHAIPVADLRTALAGGLEVAGKAHGTQGSGQGAAWNFPLRGSGTVVEANLDTRARTISVDTTGNGTADVTVQLGPVFRGTALRDVAPFYNFDDFRDQIEFAKLARALNDQIAPLLKVPEGALVGLKVTFTGVVPLKAADEAMVVTPISVEFGQ